MSKPNSAMGRSRDFGLPGGPGKGDSDRTTNRTAFNENLSEVKFDGVTGLRKVGLKFVKTYGVSAKPAPPQDNFAETDGEWPDVIGIGPSTPVTNDIIRE